jgi:hypothetical protein
LKNTKGIHNQKLLRDAARKIYRFSLNRNDENPKDLAKRENEFWGNDNWREIDHWQYHDASCLTAWYLIYGCKASLPTTVEILKSLGLHERTAVNSIKHMPDPPAYIQN